MGYMTWEQCKAAVKATPEITVGDLLEHLQARAEALSGTPMGAEAAETSLEAFKAYRSLLFHRTPFPHNRYHGNPFHPDYSKRSRENETN